MEYYMKSKKYGSKFAGKGYYIALILCAAAIGISGYMYYRNTNKPDPQAKDPSLNVGLIDPTDDGIAAIATHYGRTEVDVLDTTGLMGDHFGMARIIHAKAMLAAYAALHPELSLTLSVTDDQLTENTGHYRLTDGQCHRLTEPCPDAEAYTIAQLTHRVLTEENPLMSLMMND